MALPIFQRTVTNSAGDVIEGAQVSVFDESTGLLSTIYSNREGTTALSNPFLTGSDGLASFYAQQGEYRISVSSVAGSVTWRYQPLIGTLDEGASVLQAGIYAQESAGYANTAIEARDAAIGAANYKGNWEGKTGAGVIGESYLHKASFIYRLNVNLANLSTSEPSPTNTDWVFIQEVPFEAPCKPTLDLDFANQDFTIYTKTGGFVKSPLSDLVTQGRATAGSSVDAIGGITEFASGENRFTFDGETGEALGYLSEESRTNLLKYSEDFTNAVWQKVSISIGSHSVWSPTDSLQEIVEDTGSTSKQLRAPVKTLNSGVAHSISFIVKENNCDVIAINEGSITGAAITYRFSTGVTSLTNSQLSDFEVEDLGFGWVRISAKFTPPSTASYLFRLILLGNNYDQAANPNPAAYTYTGDGVSGVYIAGAQLEVGSFPTSYIKTLGTAVTRSSDSMTRTLGNEWNPNEGTFVVELSDRKINANTTSVIFQAGDSSGSSVIALLRDAGVYEKTYLRVLNQSSSFVNAAEEISESTRKFAVSYVNGETIRISTDLGVYVDYTLPDNYVVIFNSMGVLCRRGTGTFTDNASIKRLTYYPRAFDSITLQRLSRIQ